jgi:hypothetical protein
MPRFNVEHNGKWACFSSIVDGFITSFTDKEEYEKWRLEEYGRGEYEPAEKCNMYTMAEAIERASLNKTENSVIENLVQHGINKIEAEELYNKYKIDEDDEDDEDISELDANCITVVPHTTITITSSKAKEEEENYVKVTGQLLYQKIGDEFTIEYKGDLKWEIRPKLTHFEFVVKYNEPN